MGCTMLYEYGKRPGDFFEAFLFFFLRLLYFWVKLLAGIPLTTERVKLNYTRDVLKNKRNRVKLRARCPQKQKESSEITRAMPQETEGIK